MVCSAVFIMDLKGKILISRNYRGDIPMSVSEKFTKHLSVEREAREGRAHAHAGERTRRGGANAREAGRIRQGGL